VSEQVEEVVMESTAQYWRPVWDTLEQNWAPPRRTRAGASAMAGTLHLAQAQSNRGASGRKKDFPDAERLVRRLVAQELTLSFVPAAEQRLWRAVKTKGSIFDVVYRRLVPRLGHAQAIGAITHRLCRLIWKLLHQGVTYVERGPAVTQQRAQRRAAKMIRELRSLGYHVELTLAPSGTPA
jgi:hypothetical protein